MKKVFFVVGSMLLMPLFIYAGEVDFGIDKGKNAIFGNITISSYSTTAILSSTNLAYCSDWDLRNNGSYDLYIATYASFNTAGTTCRKILAGESYSPGGANRAPIYGLTEAASAYTNRVDYSIFK